jgi:hypothetical protein
MLEGQRPRIINTDCLLPSKRLRLVEAASQDGAFELVCHRVHHDRVVSNLAEAERLAAPADHMEPCLLVGALAARVVAVDLR